MSSALLSLLALLVAIVLSMTTRINVGLVALVLAWGVALQDPGLGAEAVVRAFPTPLFLTLTGVTLLFAIAYTNGTLDGLAHRAGRLARSDARRLGPIFFFIACGLAAVGPGSVSSVALIAPLAMAVAARAGVPSFLMALMIANGANAGNLSPISAVGVIANTKMLAAGIPPHPAKVMIANFVASALVAVVAYVMLGGHRLSRKEGATKDVSVAGAWTRPQRVTLIVIAIWILGGIFLRWSLANLGLSALCAATVLILFRMGDESRAVAATPWNVILMVSGVSTLVGLLEATGGMDLFTTLLAKLATAGTINGVIAFVTGAISIYSSTSGVVLPAFLPTVPGLVAKLGGGDPLAISLSINVGASLVDVSPLSTLGALCLAAVTDQVDARALFRRLMTWGLAMAVVGAALCQLFAGPLARW
jgi:di/tricarboxylate transporter